jgi:hypothetical protein
MTRLLAIAALLLGACNVNDYCLNCALVGDGGDVIDTPITGDAPDTDADDAAPCVPSGEEVCDGDDNDCDGNVDEEPLPAPIGDLCVDIGGVSGPAVGECAGGVKACIDGEVRCNKPPMPEKCDDLDNNCNGVADENNPEGGGQCGTNVGECVAGVLTCNSATQTVECVGATGPTAEICDNLDNDCDGFFDNAVTGADLPKLTDGVCGGGPGTDPDEGECQEGTLTCNGGVFVCLGSTGPSFELCDVAGLDQDCDGQPNNGYDTMTDPQNCGGCGMACNLPHAIEGCNGACTVLACETGYHDNDTDPSNGCEFGPCTIAGNEVCNGLDDDCSGTVDDNLGIPPAICGSGGECGDQTPIADCAGEDGWQCSYPGAVQTDSDGRIVNETLCDGLDNDCDGAVDEGQPNLFEPCADLGVGVCQGTGEYQCDPIDPNGPAICVISQMGGTASPEICDDKDNDCDGTVDNTTGPNRVIDAMTHVQYGAFDFYIDTYEASRPDAETTNVSTSRACSNANALPWTNVTFAAAQAACQAAGKVLCTGTEWQAACEGASNTTYPYGDTFESSTCNTESFNGPSDDALVATGSLAGCVSGPGANDLSGNVKEWTDDITGTTPGGKSIVVVRGGAFDTPAAGATCDFRLSRAAENISAGNTGFRCCKATAP